MTRPRTALGESLHVHGEAVDHVEALYLQAAGEVTDEIEAAEAARDVSARDALEHLARYLAWLDDQDDAVKRERERLADLEARTANRREWAQAMAADLAEAVAPGRSRVQVGTRVVKVQRTTAVETAPDLDLAAVPSSWLRDVPEVPAKPATVALDKKAAKADMLMGYREGEPPGPGWYDVEEHGRVWIGKNAHGWFMNYEATDPQWGGRLSEWGVSIDPQPGLDQLRWKPAPPGVTLVHRVHVKVG